jgi:type II secretory pathway pseudopilin PulG
MCKTQRDGSKGTKMQQRQRGISLVGLILVLALLGFVLVLGLKIVPTYTEYRAIQNAIVTAKATGGGVIEIQKSFDASAIAGYISSISGRDLIIEKVNGETEISFAYEKKIPLVGPASLLLDYAGTTDKGGAKPTKSE